MERYQSVTEGLKLYKKSLFEDEVGKANDGVPTDSKSASFSAGSLVTGSTEKDSNPDMNLFSGAQDQTLHCPNCGQSNYSTLRFGFIHCNNCGVEDTTEVFTSAKPAAQTEISVAK